MVAGMTLREMFVKTALDRRTGAEDRARKAALAYVDTFSNGDIDARLALFAPEASFEDPVGTPPITGHAALRAFWEQGAALGVAITVEHIAANAGSAAMLFTARLTAAGSAPVAMRVIEIVEVDESGLIVRMHAYFDETSIV